MSSNPFDKDEEPEAWKDHQEGLEEEYKDTEDYPPENMPDELDEPDETDSGRNEQGTSLILVADGAIRAIARPSDQVQPAHSAGRLNLIARRRSWLVPPHVPGYDP